MYQQAIVPLQESKVGILVDFLFICLLVNRKL